MHPYFLDRLARDQWEALARLAGADAAARRRSRRPLRDRSGRRARLARRRQLG